VFDLDPADSLLYMPDAGNPSIEIKAADGLLIFRTLPAGSGGTFIIQPVDDGRGCLRGWAAIWALQRRYLRSEAKRSCSFRGYDIESGNQGSHQTGAVFREAADPKAGGHMKNRISLIVRSSLLFLIPTLLVFLLSGCRSSDALYTGTIAEAGAAASEAMAESEATGLTLAVVDGERVIWTECRGYADWAAKKPVLPETMFGIGSVSKMFATIAVMKLVDKERISLKEPLATYLPQFSMLSPEYRNVTVQMLLNHSAGLPGGDLRDSLSREPFDGFAAQVMDSLKYQRLKHAPGYLNVYSNDGFTMVENLVKAVTGMSYPEYVRKEILAPLGMNDSAYTDLHLPDGSYAKTYTGDATSPYAFLHPYASLNMYATGGLYSSAADMAKLTMMLINGGVSGGTRILSSGSIVAMSQDQTVGTFNPEPSDFIRYGLGWDTVTEAGLSAAGIRGWQKSGAISGPYGNMFHSTMIIAPDAGLGVVAIMASNKTSSDTVTKLGERVMLRALVDRGMLAAMPAPLPQNPLPVVAPTAGEKDTFKGFHAASGALYRLSFAANDSLNIDKYRDGAWQPLYQGFRKRSDGWYAADGDSITALRLLTSSGRSYIAVRKKEGAGNYATTSLMAQRLDPRNPISAAWQERLSATWLPVNEGSMASYPDLLSDAGSAPMAVDGVTGYLLMGTAVLRDMDPQTNGRLDGMFLQIPQIHGRDLTDAAIERREDSDWLRIGSSLSRPLSGVPSLPTGSTTVAIGTEGFAEWRKLPAAGSISIGNAAAWGLYNGELQLKGSGRGNGRAALPGSGSASYLVLYGAPGTRIDLNLIQ
jgi:CubicO group peptidase (beta-lactamase class C family)